MSCQVVTEYDAADGFTRRCRKPALYQAVRIPVGCYPRVDEVECCEDHARDALSEGHRVIGPSGDDVRVDDETGELVAVSS